MLPADWPLLSLLIWLPILGGVACLFFGDKRAPVARSFALLVSIIKIGRAHV